MITKLTSANLLSDKAKNLEQLCGAGVPILPTLIIPSYHGDTDISWPDIFGAEEWCYIRICFPQSSRCRRIGGIANRESIAEVAAGLLSRACFPGDLIVQPFATTQLSGAALKRNEITYIEAVIGLSPFLLQKGRYWRRSILLRGETVCEEEKCQSIQMAHRNGRIVTVPVNEVRDSNWARQCCELDKCLGSLNNVVVEWAWAQDQAVFLDLREVSQQSCFSELWCNPPGFPRSISCASADIPTESANGKVLRLEYPELDYLQKAQRAGTVLCKQGAALSHLAVYSLAEGYRLAFLE